MQAYYSAICINYVRIIIIYLCQCKHTFALILTLHTTEPKNKQTRERLILFGCWTEIKI